MSARRNAFLMLFNEAEHIAIDFLSDHIDDIQKYGDGFALLVLELTRKTCRRDPAQKSRFVRCLFQLLRSDSPAGAFFARLDAPFFCLSSPRHAATPFSCHHFFFFLKCRTRLRGRWCPSPRPPRRSAPAHRPTPRC